MGADRSERTFVLTLVVPNNVYRSKLIHIFANCTVSSHFATPNICSEDTPNILTPYIATTYTIASQWHGHCILGSCHQARVGIPSHVAPSRMVTSRIAVLVQWCIESTY